LGSGTTTYCLRVERRLPCLTQQLPADERVVFGVGDDPGEGNNPLIGCRSRMLIQPPTRM